MIRLVRTSLAVLAFAGAVLSGFAPPAMAQPQDIEAPGPVAHDAAGTSFPERVGAFERIRVTRYDPRSSDLSANYHIVRGSSRLLVTVYIFPPRVATPEACGEEAEAARYAINQNHPGAQAVAAGAAPTVPGIDPSASHHAVFAFETAFTDRVQPVRSSLDLYCGVSERWMVKYRGTWDLGFQDAEREIETMIRTGPWPGRRNPGGAGPGAMQR